MDVTGTWRGVIVHPGSTITVWLRANQAVGGADVEGTYLTDTLSSGNVTGRVEADRFRFSAIVTTPGCPGELNGIATVAAGATPPSMVLTYSGSTDCGPDAGQFVLERELTAPPR